MSLEQTEPLLARFAEAQRRRQSHPRAQGRESVAS
jgi:hypothetical protein